MKTLNICCLFLIELGNFYPGRTCLGYFLYKRYFEQLFEQLIDCPADSDY
jgi:hypothetical protein